MTKKLLEIHDLSAGSEDKEILHHVNLALEAGTCNVLMGPNGAGKSTLGHVIMGDPAYTIASGSILFDEQDITDKPTYKRSLAGLFLSFQAPVEVPGVPLYSFLRTICQARSQLKMTSRQFRKHVSELAEELDMDTKYLTRDLGVGFSGGEKKKVEMLQLLLLEPQLAILDETDSGLDVDALSVVSKGIATYRERTGGTLLVITHNTRILEKLTVDNVHVMVDGTMVAAGCAELIPKIDAHGFEQFERVSTQVRS